MARRLILAVFLMSVLGIVQASPVRIGVSLLPLENLVQEIGGNTVEVRSLQREGDSCSVFEPRPSSIAWLSEAKVFFRIGAGYESMIMNKLQAQFPEMSMVDLRDAVETVEHIDHEDTHQGHNHEHGHDCEGCETEDDPHIWLDPIRLMALATEVEHVLAELRPENAAMYASAAKSFRVRLSEAHERLSGQLRDYRGSAFYIYHPALGYFADRYDLEQVAIAESSQGPTVKHLQSIINQARNSGVRTVFVQPQESRRHAEIVANAIGADVVEIDPMSTDLIPNLVRIGDALAGAFKAD